jgi:hypothetical protein
MVNEDGPPLAGQPAPAELLLDSPALLAAYFRLPDVGQPGQRCAPSSPDYAALHPGYKILPGDD